VGRPVIFPRHQGYRRTPAVKTSSWPLSGGRDGPRRFRRNAAIPGLSRPTGALLFSCPVADSRRLATGSYGASPHL